MDMDIAGQIAGVLSLLFAAALAVAVVIRVIRAVRQRKAGRLREELGGPLMGAVAVDSRASGFHPSAPSAIEHPTRSDSQSAYPTDDDGAWDCRRGSGERHRNE
ncbi:hypothetical protein BJ994_000144 [Arthrobacter pigmenti]|uniref:Uncharacterized protein n=1 Tax=Arthrobacter pigmenti TaxID=271432 RepID=A0A846RD81_9MICC|nr:hypothetical protein [Arthrobacter pigmenti]NJC21068.1 hypothetical protein [Arthrobacter pigmenti]